MDVVGIRLFPFGAKRSNFSGASGRTKDEPKNFDMFDDDNIKVCRLRFLTF